MLEVLRALRGPRVGLAQDGSGVAPDLALVIVDPAARAQRHLEARVGNAAIARAKRSAAAVSQQQLKASDDAVKLTALMVPGAAGVLGVAKGVLTKLNHHPPMEAMVRLAISSKVTGSGGDLDRVRRLQHHAYALVGSSALYLQEQGVERWLEEATGHAEGGKHFIRGWTLSWDEASQKLRALAGRSEKLKEVIETRSQSRVDVMATLASVCQMRAEVGVDGHVKRCLDTQPWLCQPLVLERTDAAHLIEGLLRVVPCNLSDKAARKNWCTNALAVIGTFCFDSASSNLLTMRLLIGFLEGSSLPVLIHGERCSVHQMHIVKASCLVLTKLASMLYCVSKVLKLSRTLSGLRDMIFQVVSRRLVVRYGQQAPDVADLRDAALAIFGVDGNEDQIYFLDRHGNRKMTGYFKDICEMIEKSRFDVASKEWVYYADVRCGVRPRLSHDEMVHSIAMPICRIFVYRRWPTAALSRWVGVMECLKKACLGMMMMDILPESLAGLSGKLNIDERVIQEAAVENARRLLAGEEMNLNKAVHDSRVLKVSRYFGNFENKWQIVVILKAACIVDFMHWGLLGRGGRRPPADLHGLVDINKSLIAEALSACLCHLLEWRLDGRWALLKFFGMDAGHMANPESMRWARRVLLQVGAGIWLRMELRFASWPYRLQWLITDSTSEAEKDEVAQQFIDEPACCLGSFCKALRRVFGSVAELRCEECKSVIMMFIALVRFNTADTEREHKLFADDIAAPTTATSHSIAGWRAVCRHLHHAHLARGGVDHSLAWRRKAKGAEARGSSSAQTALPAPSQHAALSDEAPAMPLAIVSAAPEVSSVKALSDIVAHLQSMGVGGGNPKVVFLNYRIHSYKELHSARPIKKHEIDKARAASVAQYDGDAELRARWLVIFRAVHKYNKRVTANRQGDRALVIRASNREPVWPSTMQDAEEECHELPIAPTTMASTRAIVAPTRQSLAKLVQDATKFSIVSSSLKTQAPSASGALWGCGCQLHNVCVTKVLVQ